MTKRILSRVQWREIARRKSRRVYRRLTRQCCNVRTPCVYPVLSGREKSLRQPEGNDTYESVRVSSCSLSRFGYTELDTSCETILLTANLPRLFK